MAFGGNPTVLGSGLPIATGGVSVVSGPASSTDNAIVRWNGTGGNLVQDSAVTVADTTGNFSVPANWTITPAGASTSGQVLIAGGSVSTASNIVARLTATNTATSGTNVGVSILPTYNQASGTAANTDLLINRTETAVGSGTQLLADFQVGGSSRFSVSNAGLVIASGSIRAGAASALAWVGRAKMESPADSVITLLNGAGSDFARLQFGGTTSSFPALKRSSATLQVRLADDSANATLTAATYIGDVQALSGAGAANVTQLTTALTTTGAGDAVTLANGTAGQLKTIVHDVDGGSAVLTPATATGFTNITFTNVGETATLQYFTTRGWMILALNGAVAA